MDTLITLHDIVQWEQLRDKSFSDFNGKEEDDIFTLLYVHDFANKRTYSCESFCEVMHQEVEKNKMRKELKALLKTMRHEFHFVEQFSIKHNDEDKDSAKAHDNDYMDEKAKLTPTIMAIIFQGGVDAKWLLEQGLDMLPVMAHGLLEKQQKEMENQRFWSLLLLSPHVKKSDMDKLRRSMKYPWEKIKAGLDKITKKDVSLAHAIFGAPTRPRREGVKK